MRVSKSETLAYEREQAGQRVVTDKGPVVTAVGGLRDSREISGG